jgi:hypothetical protein
MTSANLVTSVIWAIWLFGFAVAPAFAQTPPRVLLDLGAAWSGGGTFGTADATYTAPDGSVFTLFSTKNSISGGFGGASHLLVRVTPRVAAEISGSFLRPALRSTTSADFEGVDPVTATQRISQFTLGGGAVVRLRDDAAWIPFLRGHAAWLRQLSGDFSLYQDGVAYEAGGGVFHRWKHRAGHFRPYGLRIDGMVSIRRGGIEPAKGKTLISPAFSIALVVKP